MNRLITAIIVLVCGVAPLALGQESPATTQPATQPAAAPVINLRRTVTVDVVRRTKDAVVYIATKKMAVVARRMSLFPESPFDFGFKQLVRVPATALGSGFIVHPDGYVVTNNHVVAGARQITVELADGRKLDADLISADPTADLAILKVTTDKPLPCLQLGDSSDLMIGEPVIAVGNPMGYSHSVSTGIVSALHRDIKVSDHEQLDDVIQTDAAINPGNSGGPLLNAYGQVIGINTAIRGDAQNIGFAIQVNRLRDMIPNLLNPTQAVKLDIPIKLAESRTITEPATITSTVELCEPGDKRVPVSTIDGKHPRNIVDAYAMLLTSKAGQTIDLKLADGSEKKVTVKPAAVPEAVAAIKKRIGLTVEELTPMIAQKDNVAFDDGILITDVSPASIGDSAGLKPGDVIDQAIIPIGQGRSLIYPLTNLDKFAILVQRLPADAKIKLMVHRGKRSGTVDLDMGAIARNST